MPSQGIPISYRRLFKALLQASSSQSIQLRDPPTDIISKCSYRHPSKVFLQTRLIYYCQNYRRLLKDSHRHSLNAFLQKSSQSLSTDKIVILLPRFHSNIVFNISGQWFRNRPEAGPWFQCYNTFFRP